MRSSYGSAQYQYRGFTLVELLTVISIIGVLAALIFPVFSRVRESARATACMSNLKQIGIAVGMYLDDYDSIYPMSRMPDATHPVTGCTAPTNHGNPEDGLQGSGLNWKRCIEAYIKDRAVYQCPSNPYAWNAGGYNNTRGDETNAFYGPGQALAASYAYNGSFFHEAVPPCWYGEPMVRPRGIVEIDNPSNLILLLESRFNYPDLGGWFIGQRAPDNGTSGPFQSHNGACDWLFADQHAKRIKLAETCAAGMWTDRYLDAANGCAHLDEMADEYR